MNKPAKNSGMLLRLVEVEQKLYTATKALRAADGICPPILAGEASPRSTESLEGDEFYLSHNKDGEVILIVSGYEYGFTPANALVLAEELQLAAIRAIVEEDKKHDPPEQEEDLHFDEEHWHPVVPPASISEEVAQRILGEVNAMITRAMRGEK